MAQTYSLIQAQTLTSTASSVTFSNIPQNYTDLIVKVSARSNRGGDQFGDLFIRFNNDSGSNYSTKYIQGSGSAASSGGNTSTEIFWMLQNAGLSTSNTFSNGEIYIPNYTSSLQKSVSIDMVNENNATIGLQRMIAAMWTGTTAINTITIFDGNSALILANSTFYLYGVDGARATGGTITSDANYTYHTFTSSNTFTALEKINNAQILLVAGGGGGGGGTFTNANSGGGGGAGGVVYSAGQTFTAGTSYSAIVGAGGAGGSTSVGIGSRGQSSTFISSEAIGGGGGGSETGGHGGTTGGSGGGASSYSTISGSAGTAGQGNAGGSTAGSNGAAAGGGGAGGVGINATNGSFDPGAPGGVGTTAYNYWHYATSTGVLSNGTYYIAGGGGGGSYRSTGGAGGLGGGGQGGQSTNDNDTAGTANTGGGGGGSANQGAGRAGSAGGSGLVIIRYPNI